MARNTFSNKQRNHSLVAAVGGVPVAAIAGALGAALWLGGPSTRPVTAQDPANLTQEQRSTATSLEGAFEKVADSVGPATVSIKARTEGASGRCQQPTLRRRHRPSGHGR